MGYGVGPVDSSQFYVSVKQRMKFCWLKEYAHAGTTTSSSTTNKTTGH